MALQNALAGVTFPVQTDSPPSGVFDEATEDALLKFQKSVSVPQQEWGYVSVYTMEQMDLMLGIQACPSFGLYRIGDDEVTSDVSDGAVAVLDSYWDFPIGTEIPYYADGKTFVGRVELHFHSWEGTTTPKGYHHGVSVFGFEESEAVTGSEFLKRTAALTIEQREAQILLLLAKRNIPHFLDSKWINVTASNSTTGRSVTYSVLPDYLAIGTDADYVRVPVMAFTAQKLADLNGASVPTTMMVDQIWSASEIKLEPQPLNPGDFMCSNPYVGKENNLIEDQLAKYGGVQGSLVAGDKKDTVLTNEYLDHPDSVAEYGWHQLDGTPIQPLYLGHSSDWADYSMGIRFVSSTVYVDVDETGFSNDLRSLGEVLADEQLAPLLSNEGVINSARVPINPRPACTCWENA